MLRILGQVHLRSNSTSRVLLGHYQSLTLSLINTLPQQCCYLSGADVAELLLACSNLSQPPKASEGGKLEDLGLRIADAASQQTVHVLLPDLVDRLVDTGAPALPGEPLSKISYALSQLPPAIRQSTLFATVCEHLSTAGSSAAVQMTASQACTVLSSGVTEPLLMPSTSGQLINLLSHVCVVDSSRLRRFLTPRMQLQLMWSLHEVKLRYPVQYQAAFKAVDMNNLCQGLTAGLRAAFAVRPCTPMQNSSPPHASTLPLHLLRCGGAPLWAVQLRGRR